ncbi:MAG: UDP-3-O-(3-hydroxymyristoyl)glucosamine N-acyltransferase [Deltaproteobacteria bacterium GWC2_42_11]|nr:MAG: UDP-3-O-(3-hydroxymyristoyl)glucosamine N-acyltransferase [Deltaproteobacteria bacterium GWC2_42_11]HBO85021.1 UDP-3-O-(3-hydroxymyristoyl)glucosamine N-acyltransferase [Deltaproteobacteria bacterium]
MEKSLNELAKLVNGDVIGDGSVLIKGVAGIEDAVSGQITFISNPKYTRLIYKTEASAVIASPDILQSLKDRNILCAKNPYLAFAKILEYFTPKPTLYQGIHPKAEVHPNTVIDASVSIYSHVYIEEGARIGSGVVLYPGVYIGRDVFVGDDTVIYSNVSVRERCRIGSRVIIHCNSVIGSDGFGFAKEGVKLYKIPQTGVVRIENDVEIGACVTIDRATLGETVIKRGTKIDNLVQIAHNVVIGEDSVIVAQVGISGSTRIGDRVTLAGQVGVAGHIEIGNDITIGAKSGVTHDLPAKGIFSGMPAIPHREWLKAVNIFAKLPELRKKILELENKIKELEGKETREVL